MENDDQKSVPVCSHFEPALHQAFDAWRRAQKTIPTKSKGVAYLTRLGIETDRRRQSKPETTITA